MHLVISNCNPCFVSRLKGCHKNRLLVLWRSSKKRWVTKTVFGSWFKDYIYSVVKNYCEKQNIAFKILLLDNASVHPTGLSNLCNDVEKFSFSPILQGVIPTAKASKAFYLKRTLSQTV